MDWIELAGVVVALIVGVVGVLHARTARADAQKAADAARKANDLAEAANRLAGEANEAAQAANEIAEKGYGFASALRWTLSLAPQTVSTPQNSAAPFGGWVKWLLVPAGAYTPIDVTITFSHDPESIHTTPTRWSRIRLDSDGVEINSGYTESQLVGRDVEAKIIWADPTGAQREQKIPHVPVFAED